MVCESALSQMSAEGLKAMREGMARARMKEAGKDAMAPGIQSGNEKRNEGYEGTY